MRLQVRDWPGFAGPLVHVPDPLTPSTFVDSVAALIAPQWRVFSVSPRAGVGYQTSALDLVGVMDQFGFEDSPLLVEGLGYATALVVAAWYPERVENLVLVEPRCQAEGESIEARALRECPPNWPALRTSVKCGVTQARGAEEVVARLR